ncbi:MAG: hypothetical protein COZ18_03170 [Flexibacter sp. CG_4_10_14_3_um_filter_32_15]|nr:MAG: hypothetical protein COZ18_03170 [Flexibacter sp. CG_4_10_14_3_um_filter_32_15]
MTQISNKFSSFIGIILLIRIIGFIVFINFFVEEPIEPTEEIEEEKAEMTKEYLVLDSTVLTNLWKLENLKTFISIDKTLGMSDYNPLKDANYDKMSDSIKQMFEQVYSNNSSESEFIISYEVLAFEYANHNNEDDEITLEIVKIISFNDIHSDSVLYPTIFL